MKSQRNFCQFAVENAGALAIPASLDSRRLTYAFAKVESGLGIHSERTRFEPSYSGNHFRRMPANTTMYERSKMVKDAWARWGDSAACSYGLFQIMYTTALTLGVLDMDTPPEALRSDSVNFAAFAKLINKICYDKPDITLEKIADAYNSGNFTDNIVPTAYINKILSAYAESASVFQEYDDV